MLSHLTLMYQLVQVTVLWYPNQIMCRQEPIRRAPGVDQTQNSHFPAIHVYTCRLFAFGCGTTRHCTKATKKLQQLKSRIERIENSDGHNNYIANRGS